MSCHFFRAEQSGTILIGYTLARTHAHTHTHPCTTCEWFLKCQEGQCDFIIAIISYLKIWIPSTNSVLFSLMVCVECHTDAVCTCTALKIRHNVGSWHSPNVASRDLWKNFLVERQGQGCCSYLFIKKIASCII